ncbi:MAG: antibiotic biosynthesis monooxygenase family protein [Acidimicrobiia bacterium]
MQPRLYTSGDWYVRAESEQAFIEGWLEFGEWTAANVSGNTFAKLLQDDADPGHFISFGPWRDESAVAAWREHPGFKERVSRLQELLEPFVPGTMTLAAEIGQPTPDPW